MKGLKRIEKWEEFNFEIKEVTLLSIEEYKKYRPIIPLLKEWWWLRSPSRYQSSVAGIGSGGGVRENGRSVRNIGLAVRPALKIQTSSLESFKLGNKLDLLNKKWTVLDISEDILYILCDENIGYHRFDAESNVWETSELKKWLKTQFIVSHLA